MHILAIEQAIKDITRGFLNKEARWIEIAIEHLESFSMDQSSYRKAIKNAIKEVEKLDR